MKKPLGIAVVFAALILGSWACSHSGSSPSGPYGGAPTPTFTPTSLTTPTTPSATATAAPQTLTVSTGTSGASSTGYVYTSSSGTNSGTGVLSLTAHVGDTIDLPGSSFHPLYFDAGTTTCIYTGATSNQSYTFPAAGTYYFHCGNHATGCSMGNGACGSTNCSAMAGVVTVN